MGAPRVGGLWSLMSLLLSWGDSLVELTGAYTHGESAIHNL